MGLSHTASHAGGAFVTGSSAARRSADSCGAPSAALVTRGTSGFRGGHSCGQGGASGAALRTRGTSGFRSAARRRPSSAGAAASDPARALAASAREAS